MGAPTVVRDAPDVAWVKSPRFVKPIGRSREPMSRTIQDSEIGASVRRAQCQDIHCRLLFAANESNLTKSGQRSSQPV